MDDTNLEKSLSIEESTLCEGNIIAFECKQAIVHKHNNKSPGCDGRFLTFNLSFDYCQ
jgi:hypothetical protein